MKYEFGIGHVTSDRFAGWNSPHNIRVVGTVRDAFEAFGIESEANPFGWAIESFEEAALTGRGGNKCGVYIAARPV